MVVQGNGIFLALPRTLFGMDIGNGIALPPRSVEDPGNGLVPSGGAAYLYHEVSSDSIVTWF